MMATTTPKHGLYLQNCHVYLGDLATPKNIEVAQACNLGLRIRKHAAHSLIEQ